MTSRWTRTRATAIPRTPATSPAWRCRSARLSDLTLGGLTLEPAFASGAEAYTASAAHAVTSTTVTATLNNHADGVSITKGADTYADGDNRCRSTSGPNLIAIEVTASDGSTTPHTYSVTVTRAPNTPPVFDEGAAATRGVDEDTFADQNIGDPLRATDADSADTLTYSLDTASDAFFDIDATTGQLRTEAELDHENRKSYPVTVSVSDGKDANGDADPSADDTITVTILVSDVNEDPSFALANDTRTIAENTPAGVTLGAPFTATDGDGDILTYSLGAGSAEDFEIDAAYGQLRTRAVLDYEATSSYNLTVTATDPSADSNSITVTVTVENVEEPGAVMLSSVQPRVGDTLNALLTDPDMVSGAVTWSWERSTSRTSGWTAVSRRRLGELPDGRRRRELLPARHRLLRRRSRRREERLGGLRQPGAGAGARQHRSIVPVGDVRPHRR